MLQKIEGCIVETAKTTEEIENNVKVNVLNQYLELEKNIYWRNSIPIALVGGGPSLKETIKDLAKYKYIMACGSVHDYLIENDVLPKWCALIDPDPLIINYLQEANKLITYLVASQCDPKVFEHLKYKSVYLWHAYGEKYKPEVYGEGKILVGGGCTIGTRAIMLALGMGFSDLHLYGFDTCLDEKYNHHAYEFSSEEETIGDIKEITLGVVNGKKYKVAGYMLGQLIDFQAILKSNANKLNITIHGDGLLKDLMEMAKNMDNNKANKIEV